MEKLTLFSLFNLPILTMSNLDVFKLFNFFFVVEYTEENPKIVAKCSHHFHLSCIYEWMERSDYCPVCGKVLSLSLSLSLSFSFINFSF
jgi:RING-H2 zinc finger domain